MPTGDPELEPRGEAVTLLVEKTLAEADSTGEALLITVPLAATEKEAAPEVDGTNEPLAQPLSVSLAAVPEGCGETLPNAVLEAEVWALLEIAATVAVTAELTLPDFDAEAQAEDESEPVPLTVLLCTAETELQPDAEGPLETLAEPLRDAATERVTNVEAVGSGLPL